MSAAAEALEPHRIPFYLLELAGDFHRYYNKPANRIIGPDRELSLARMYMAAILKRCGCERTRIARGERSRADVRAGKMRFEIRAGGAFLILVGLVGLSGGVFALGLVAGYEMARQNQPDINQISSTYPLPNPPEKPAPVAEMSPAAVPSQSVASAPAAPIKPAAPAIGEEPPAAHPSPATVARLKPVPAGARGQSSRDG